MAGVFSYVIILGSDFIEINAKGFKYFVVNKSLCISQAIKRHLIKVPSITARSFRPPVLVL